MTRDELYELAIDFAHDHLFDTCSTGFRNGRNGAEHTSSLVTQTSLKAGAPEKVRLAASAPTRAQADVRLCAMIFAEFIVRKCGAQRVTVTWKNGDVTVAGKEP